MKVLITGVDGFVGGHLARYLLTQDKVEVSGTTFGPVERHPDLGELGVVLYQVDLTDELEVEALVTECQPQQIYHLAAKSVVPASYDNPWDTLNNNIHAQLNVLHSVARRQIDARVLVVGSAEEYGRVLPDELPINEQQPLRPISPYSVSKVTQDMLGLQYFLSNNVAAIRVRPFNHTGPGQTAQFVVPAFASQIAAVENGSQPPVIRVGNLEARRDITDVRDVVRAYALLLSHGEPGSVYNVGRGIAYSIRELLDLLLGMSRRTIEVQADPTRTRPIESPVLVCDPTKLRAAAGWRPTYAIEQTLGDVLEDWRARLH